MKDTDYTFGTREEPMDGQDNRMQYRLTARATITLELEAAHPGADGVPGAPGREMVCGIRDISASGLCLLSREPLPVGALFFASVSLGSHDKPFVLTVEVVWCREDSQSYLGGVRIIESDQTAYVEWTDAVAIAMNAD